MTASALGGVRVLDLTRLLPGGLCTLLLADLGADVIKVEAPPGGDHARVRGPHHDSAEPTTSSASFRALNRNKRSIVLDVRTAAGRDALLGLVEDADVLVESFRPGVLDRLGLGYDVVAGRNAGIVYCSMSGWGRTGAHALISGHDVNYLAAIGLLSFTGAVEEEPALPPVQVADTTAGLFAGFAILAALHERVRSGRGQHVDISLAHSALTTAAMTVAGVLATGTASARDEGIWSGGAVCYQVYRCRDGWVALGALEEKFWTTWCRGVGREDLAGRRYDSCRSATHRDVAEVFAARTRAEWAEFAAEHDCCLSVVTGLAEALRSDLVRDRGAVVRLTQSPGEPPYEALTLPFVLSRTPADPDRLPAPVLGADTDVVLSERDRR